MGSPGRGPQEIPAGCSPGGRQWVDRWTAAPDDRWTAAPDDRRTAGRGAREPGVAPRRDLRALRVDHHLQSRAPIGPAASSWRRRQASRADRTTAARSGRRRWTDRMILPCPWGCPWVCPWTSGRGCRHAADRTRGQNLTAQSDQPTRQHARPPLDWRPATWSDVDYPRGAPGSCPGSGSPGRRDQTHPHPTPISSRPSTRARTSPGCRARGSRHRRHDPFRPRPGAGAGRSSARPSRTLDRVADPLFQDRWPRMTSRNRARLLRPWPPPQFTVITLEQHATLHRRSTRQRTMATPQGGQRRKMSGGVLLSHAVSHAVPSALTGLASGFGMGPGVSLSLWPP